MTTLAHVRTAVKRLDEVERVEHRGLETYTVAGQAFLTVTHDRTAVQLRLPADDAATVLDDIPGATVLTRGSSVQGVTIPLSAMNGMQANAVIGRAWTFRAPQRLTRVPAVAAGVDGDLPRAIGRPATNALHGAGIATLAQVAQRTPEEIGALHGVGPKAVRLLDEALRDAGIAWRG